MTNLVASGSLNIKDIAWQIKANIIDVKETNKMNSQLLIHNEWLLNKINKVIDNIIDWIKAYAETKKAFAK